MQHCDDFENVEAKIVNGEWERHTSYKMPADENMFSTGPYGNINVFYCTKQKKWLLLVDGKEIDSFDDGPPGGFTLQVEFDPQKPIAVFFNGEQIMSSSRWWQWKRDWMNWMRWWKK